MFPTSFLEETLHFCFPISLPLASLPLELKLTIAECLDPQSSFNLALTSKDSWTKYSPVVKEHSRLFSLNKIYKNHSDFDCVMKKVLEVIEDPTKGWYIRDCTFPDIGGMWYTPNDAELIRFSEATDEIRHLYTTLPKREHEEGGPNIDCFRFHDRIKSGNGDDTEAPRAVLLHHLPYLSTLRFTSVWKIFQQAILLVAQAYDAGPLVLGMEKWKALPFKHLSTVAIAHCTYGPEDPAWCHFFLSIPTVKNFVAKSMGDDDQWWIGNKNDEMSRDSERWGKTKVKSNVKELLFTSSQFPSKVLGEILGRTAALERFTYEGGGEIVSFAYYDPKKVIQALAKNAAHSLECLDLSCYDMEEEIKVGWPRDSSDLERISLRSFTKLRTLSCDWKMIYPQITVPVENSTPTTSHSFSVESPVLHLAADFDIHQILPESLESIFLDGFYNDKEWKDICVTLGTDSALTPNLRNVHVGRWFPSVTRLRGSEELPPRSSLFHELHD